jgi:hypothetical protein
MAERKNSAIIKEISKPNFRGRGPALYFKSSAPAEERFKKNYISCFCLKLKYPPELIMT